MKRELLQLLRCPETGQLLELKASQNHGGEIQSGELCAQDGRVRYEVRDFVARFVRSENYASSFGYQWNRFRRTQLDSHTGVPISSERFYRFSGWRATMLEGKWALDAGCGRRPAA